MSDDTACALPERLHALAIEESGRFWAARPGGGFEVTPDVTPDELLHRCDTVGCVAGWTAAVGASARVRKNLIASEVGWIEVAKGLLGLTYKQANRLFMAGADSIWVDFAPVFGWEVP